jgi:hypothetical protein
MSNTNNNIQNANFYNNRNFLYYFLKYKKNNKK